MTVFLDKEIKTKTIVEFQCQSRNIWTTMEYRADTQNSYRANVYANYAVTKGKNYRVKAAATVWEGRQSETQTVFSKKQRKKCKFINIKSFWEEI